MPPNVNAASSNIRWKMKLLFDANRSHKLVSRLADAFPEASHVRMIGLNDQSDLAIWNYAKDQGLTIVTLDEDFYSSL